MRTHVGTPHADDVVSGEATTTAVADVKPPAWMASRKAAVCITPAMVAFAPDTTNDTAPFEAVVTPVMVSVDALTPSDAESDNRNTVRSCGVKVSSV